LECRIYRNQSFQSGRLFPERRPVSLTPEEEEVRRLVFGDLPAREVPRVLSIGSWTTVGPGERLLERGKSVESISLIVRGNVQMPKEGHVLGELGAWEIVGSALVLSGATPDVDAVTVTPTRTLRWDVGTLERYLNSHPETRNVLQWHLARDLAGKLQRMATVVSNNSASRPSSSAGQ